MPALIDTPLKVSMKMAASGETENTKDNSAGLAFNIPVTGVDVSAHSWDFQIDSNSFIKMSATGDGAGSIVSKAITYQSNGNHLSTLVGPNFAFDYFSLTGLAQPFLDYDPTTYGAFEISSQHGGLSITGLSDNEKTGLVLQAIIGSNAPDQPAILLSTLKADGIGGTQPLGAAEISYEVNNGNGLLFDLFGNGSCSINGATWNAASRLNIRAPNENIGTGTISNAGTGTVTGTGTLFLAEIAVGDKIVAQGSASNQGSTVLSIIDNTHLTVDYPSIWGGNNFNIIKPLVRITSGGNELNARIYPNGDFYGQNVHAMDAGSTLALSAPGFPKLTFGFGDPTINNCLRTAGGTNQDMMLDVFGTTGGVAAHWFGVNGFFKTGYGAVIGDNTFAIVAPANGLYVAGAEQVKGRIAVGNTATLAAVGTTDKIWDFSQNFTDFSGLTQFFALQSFNTIDSSADVTAAYGHAVFKSNIISTNTKNYARVQGAESYMQQDGLGNVTQLTGFEINAVHNGSGTVTLMMGNAFNSSAGAACTGTITENIGGRFIVGSAAAGAHIVTNKHIALKKQNILGTIDTNYGIFIEDMDFGTDSYSIKTGLGKVEFGDRVSGTSLAAVAANNLTLGAANQFLVSGNTQINAITTNGWRAGSNITLIFSGTPTVKHNTAGGAGTAVLFLSGSADLVAANNTVLGLTYDGTQWQETFRKVA